MRGANEGRRTFKDEFEGANPADDLSQGEGCGAKHQRSGGGVGDELSTSSEDLA